MTTLADLEPKRRALVMNLVAEAGIDISNWANVKGGAAKAAANPKYCYEWSFLDRDKVAALNLWHGSMQEREGVIFHELNMREHARKCARLATKRVWETRAINMDVAIQNAFSKSLPVRVIVCAGVVKDLEDEKPEASKVRARMLDPEVWTVTAYDWNTGACRLTRGAGGAAAASQKFVDQFSVEGAVRQPEYRDVSGHVFVRSAAVRAVALARAAGNCEWCGETGFLMDDGRIYLETHHVDPLSERGTDADDNVSALCANDHRQAHYGVGRADMRVQLRERIRNPARMGVTRQR